MFSFRNPLSSESWLRGVCGDDGSEFEFKPRCEIFADTGELGDEPVKFQLNLLLPYGCGRRGLDLGDPTLLEGLLGARSRITLGESTRRFVSYCSFGVLCPALFALDGRDPLFFGITSLFKSGKLPHGAP